MNLRFDVIGVSEDVDPALECCDRPRRLPAPACFLEHVSDLPRVSRIICCLNWCIVQESRAPQFFAITAHACRTKTRWRRGRRRNETKDGSKFKNAHTARRLSCPHGLLESGKRERPARLTPPPSRRARSRMILDARGTSGMAPPVAPDRLRCRVRNRPDRGQGGVRRARLWPRAVRRGRVRPSRRPSR
jgi:hypothetical protein